MPVRVVVAKGASFALSRPGGSRPPDEIGAAAARLAHPDRSCERIGQAGADGIATTSLDESGRPA